VTGHGSNDGRRGASRGEFRLRVLNSLPDLHQRYLYGEVQKRCGRFLRARHGASSEVSLEELLSEVWKKLLGSLSIQEEIPKFPFEETSINPYAPDLDGRVIWLIEEIGGADALSHRFEDILRQRYGRTIPDVGRPLVQADGLDQLPEDVLEPSVEIVDTSVLVWHGLLQLAKERFSSEDDVSMMLQLLATAPDLFEDSVGGQWPINRIVSELNALFPEATWRADRVDNAKRRLVAWIARFKKTNGFDQTDFEALLVRIAKMPDSTRQTKQTRFRSNVLS